MQNLPFIFSNKTSYRIARHLVFWIGTIFGLGLLGLSVRPLFNIDVSQGSFREHILQPMLYLPGQLFLVYTLLYFVIPRYILRSRYTMTFLWILLLCVLAGFIAAISYDLLFPWFSEHIMHRGGRIMMVNGVKVPLTPTYDPISQ